MKDYFLPYPMKNYFLMWHPMKNYYSAFAVYKPLCL